jgi:hypothetical protein
MMITETRDGALEGIRGMKGVKHNIDVVAKNELIEPTNQIPILCIDEQTPSQGKAPMTRL